ncbi:MAG TPA: NIPSNAP family protein [Candidatus Acidoferrales bacterium]|nr:NIPSNAP family protein [Candidatus Acidoferrales bacterium]
MFVEMRTYTLKPGTTAAFEERFVEGLEARQQFSKLGGLWRSEVGSLNVVVHMWPYESFEDRERIAQAARKTGKWPPRTHEFIITQENKIIQPAPFSPSLGEKKLGNIYEFRTYTYQPTTMPTVLERFGKVMPARTKVSPLAFAGHTLIGPLNQYIHVWAYKDESERERLRAEAAKSVEGWPPQTREFIIKQENMLMVPAACSPMK